MTPHLTLLPTPLRSRRLTPGASPRLVASPCERLPSAVVHGSLDDGLMVCLGLLASENRFDAAVVAWHGRWCAELPGIGFAESRAALSALEALTGADPAAAGRALRATCLRYGLAEVAAVLDAWLNPRPRPIAARTPRHAPQGPTAA